MTLSQVPSFSIWQLALALVAFGSIYTLIQSARRLRMAEGLYSLMFGVVSLSLLYSTLAIQAYTGLADSALVARIRASDVANSPYGVPTLSVEMTTYQEGHPASEKTYLVLGNEWMLQGDMVKVSGLLGMIGLHSGYKLTQLEGRYDDPAQERAGKHTVVTLNGGDDGFFLAAHYLNSIASPFIDAAYGNAVIDGAGSYNVYVSQTGLWAERS